MFVKNIGIDLGTANVLIYVKGTGVVLNEPSVVAIDRESKRVLAVGSEANEMVGRTPGKVKAFKPMKDGVIADFELTALMLEFFLKKIKVLTKFVKPRILICCPTNITKVEKEALKEVAIHMGAKRVYIEEEPKVAAIGAGLEISKPSGNMIIDIGGGTTDIAIISLNGIVNSASLKIAGNTFDKDIIKYIKEKYKLLIGEITAEKIKIEIGCVYQSDKNKIMEIKGRDLVTGLPKTIKINSIETEEALKNSINEIIKAVKSVLEESPPELASDIAEKGITLTGGGSLLKGLSELFTRQLKVPVIIASSPLTCVAEGTGILLENLNLLHMESL